MLRSTLRSINRFSKGPAVNLCHPVSVRTTWGVCHHHARSAWWFMDGFGKEVWRNGNNAPDPDQTATNQYTHRPDTVHAFHQFDAPSRATGQHLSERALSAALADDKRPDTARSLPSFRVSGVGCRVSGFGCRVSDVGCRVSGLPSAPAG